MRLTHCDTWRALHWPVSSRTQRRYELRANDPFPVRRINGRKFVDPVEAEAWLARQAGTETEQEATEALVERAHRTGESLDDLAAERRGRA
jgi:hypothetical protein